MTGGDPGGRAVADERVVWSVDLPAADEGHLAVSPDGVLLVSSRRFLAAVLPSGDLGWLVDTRLGLLHPPVPLPGGRVVRYEDGVLVTRDLATGATISGIPLPGLSGLTGGPAGDVVYGARAGAGAVLCRSSAGGEVRWSRPLDDPYPTIGRAGEDIVATDGSVLRGYDGSGTLRWTADRAGFRTGPGAGDTVTGQVHGTLEPVPGGRVLAELSEPDGHGLYVFEPASRVVTRVSPPVGVRRPLAVVPGAPPQLAVLGPDEEVEAGRWRWTVLLTDLTGDIRWTSPVAAQPRGLLGTSDGGVIVMCSPPLARFTDYHAWYDLSGECFVSCFGRFGERQWTWQAPVPLTYAPVLAGDGTVYVAGPGRLWALRGDRPGR